MSKVELRALSRCGPNRKGEIFTEREDRARVLVKVGKAEYLTRDMVAAPRSQSGLSKSVTEKPEAVKRSRGRPKKLPPAEIETAIQTNPDVSNYTAQSAHDDRAGSSEYYGFPE